tara:strand:- start:4057 stop:4821 length:765 start_codon:yes stop_codon:yes gene_type:complete
MVMPHKGIAPVLGRLSPAVFGNFPVKSCLAKQGGYGFIFSLDDQHGTENNVPAENLRVGEGTLTAVVNSGMVITAAGSANDAATMAGPLKVDTSKRWAIEGSFNIDTIADNDNALFLGLSVNRDGDFLADGGDGAAAISASTIGAYVQRDKAGTETDSDSGVITAAEVLLATRGSSGSARIKKSGTAVAATAATKVGLHHSGDGKVKLFLNDSLVLKEELPGTADCYPVIGVKAEGSGAPALTIGPLFAFVLVD